MIGGRRNYGRSYLLRYLSTVLDLKNSETRLILRIVRDNFNSFKLPNKTDKNRTFEDGL